MLKAPDHQVAGHSAQDGMLGPLVDDSGHFYKPLQHGERGSKEVAFYESFSSDTRIPNHVRKFFPVFHGVQTVDASDGSGPHPHLVLQDLVSGRLNPSIMDVKIGARTWYPQASEKYMQKCLKKDSETTSAFLGFRISGMQIYDSKGSGFLKLRKKQVQKFSVEDIREVLRKFVSSNSVVDSSSHPDCSLASTVYGGAGGILDQLLELKAWFECQTSYHFYSCSILMMYEKESALNGKTPIAEVKLVDFAHVLEGRGVIDHNFLGGLCSLINVLSAILHPSDSCSVSNGFVESPKRYVCSDNGNGL